MIVPLFLLLWNRKLVYTTNGSSIEATDCRKITFFSFIEIVEYEDCYPGLESGSIITESKAEVSDPAMVRTHVAKGTRWVIKFMKIQIFKTEKI